MKRLNAAIVTKMCHANPGNVIELPDDDAIYMLIVLPHDPKELPTCPPNPTVNRPEGLYADPRPLALVDVETGITRKLPHLSSRVGIHRDAVLLYHNPLAN